MFLSLYINHLHDKIIFLNGGLNILNWFIFWPLCIAIGVSVPTHESEPSCICVLWGIDFASFYDFPLDFGTVPTWWYFSQY
jgi:hypothetical protein